eukprot:7169344-Karenia_brevis.AAC.1
MFVHIQDSPDRRLSHGKSVDLNFIMSSYTSGAHPTDSCHTSTPLISTLYCVRTHQGGTRLTAVAHRLLGC